MAALAVVGFMAFLAGLTFTLQGYGMVGPSNGFMFQNRTWVYAGSTTLVVGLVLVYLAFSISRRRTSRDNGTTTPNSSASSEQAA
jgi:hypothetical protein